MAFEDSTTMAALRAHSNELQSYLSEWNKKQQDMLEQMSLSILEQETARNNMFMSVSQKKPNFSAISPSIAPSPSTYNGETAALADCANREIAENSAHAAKEAHAQNTNAELETLDKYRSEVVHRFQASINLLKELVFKEDMECWLTDTIADLEETIDNLDLIGLPEQVDDIPAAKRNSATGVDTSLSDNEDVCQKLRGVVGLVVGGSTFEFLSAAVIIFNSVLMGVSTDHQIKHLAASEQSFLKNMEIAFCSYYTVELALRFIHEGKHAFIGKDRSWYWFDLVLVVLSVYDQVEFLFLPDSASPTENVSFLRLLRLLKMAKLLRMFRLMRMFKDLRLIFASIAGSIQAVGWAVLLVLITNYMGSLLFVRLCANFLMDAEKKNVHVSLDTELDIKEYWGSVLKGINSLHSATTGGDDWMNVARPLSDVGWGCYCAFQLYLGFFLIVIFNTFASLFVQTVFENQAKDRQYVIQAELEKKHEYVASLQDFYDEVDDNGDGRISLHEFLRHAKDEKLQAWATHLDIDLGDAQQFFETLSSHGTVEVDIDTFVEGCIKMRGTAKSVDLLAVYQLLKRLHKRIDECNLMLRANKGKDAVTKKKERRRQLSPRSPTHRTRSERNVWAQL